MEEKNNSNQIQWYPGHMAKARKLLQNDLKLIDIVVEVIDARAPMSTRNPDFDNIFANKTRLVLLNKSDLADEKQTKKWIQHFNSKGVEAVSISSLSNSTAKKTISLLNEIARPLVEKAALKGIRKTVRAIIVGIPNVGKSTLINNLAGKKRAATGNKPGVTKGKQWVGISKYLELMDTPGMLWPKLDNNICAKHLAYIYAINDDILNIENLAYNLYQEVNALYPLVLGERYPFLNSIDSEDRFYTLFCEGKNFLFTNKEYDTLRAAKFFLDEFRSGKIGRISLEKPEEQNDTAEGI